MTNQPETLGAYELLERLGTGGMGTVYRARDRRTSAIVAVKVIHDYLVNDASIRQRFRQEAHIASLLTSPYTVHMNEYGEDQGRYYMACEFVDGVSLSDILQQGRLEPAQALAIAAQVAMALHEAEARNVIHRDIKPSNILITRSDQTVKVTDFGISRVAYGPDITQPGTYLGTLSYSAPEQLRGDPDIRSDFYSVGVTLYQCLTGELPFQGNTPFAIAAAVEQTPPPIEKLEGLPGPVVDLVARCLRKDPGERYQTASELGAAIEAARRSLTNAGSETWVMDQTALLLDTRADRLDTPAADAPTEASLGAGAAVAAGASQAEVSAAPPREEAGAGAAAPPGGAGGGIAAALGGGGRRPLWIVAAVLGAAGIVAAVAALTFLLLDILDDDPKKGPGLNVVAATETPRPTRTPRATDTPRPATATPTGVAPTATTTAPPFPTVVPPTGTEPPLSFVTGIWTFSFVTVFNDCATGPEVGEPFTVSVTVTEKFAGDGYIEDGEEAYLFDSDGVTYLAETIFFWPVLDFGYPLIDGNGDAYLYSEFFDAHSGWGSLDLYVSTDVVCTILYEEERPAGFIPFFER